MMRGKSRASFTCEFDAKTRRLVVGVITLIGKNGYQFGIFAKKF